MRHADHFIAVITITTQNAGFSDPEKAFWNCAKFSDVVTAIGREHGIDIEIWTCSLVFKQAVYNVKKGEKRSHEFVQIDGIFYDWTNRQFDARAKFPYVSKKPYPKSVRIDSTNLDISKSRDPDMIHWYNEIKHQLTR